VDDLTTRKKSSCGIDVPLEVLAPQVQTVPFVFSSPHSGRDYPASFLASSRLDPLSLRRSEDSFVDEIFALAPSRGAPLLKACFPRAFVDPNREAWELDPAMFKDALPGYVNTSSVRVNAGLGTLARVVTNGEEIYRGKLHFADAVQRIEETYKPYHDTLNSLIENTIDKFGVCFLIDCHSMPSVGGPMDEDRGLRRVDVVLGDCHGRSCAAALTEQTDRLMTELGFTVRRNDPYSGGFTTRHYGRPRAHIHALQIEINRARYMDEVLIERGAGFDAIVSQFGKLITRLTALSAAELI
jgi:N-formylglutamate amidohydrolase